jgi:hypothetical protein
MQQTGALAYPRRPNLLGGETVCGPVQYYKLDDGGIVLGSYENNCGGVDAFDDFDTIARAVRHHLKARPPYLIFEGVIVSHIFGYWYALSESIGGMTWVFLDTPIEVCLERISARNHGKAFNTEYVRQKHRDIQRICTKATAAGEQVVVLPWKQAYSAFSELLKKRG